VIVPTRALAERRALIRRALASVLNQQNVRALPIVIINGSSVDASVARELAGDPRLRVRTLKSEPSSPGDYALPAALRAGRALVDTPFFAQLDDDDILLPGALAARLHAIRDGYDAVVSNGIRRNQQGDTVHLADVAAISWDPVRALKRSNWLLPGSWLCRTDHVPPSLFDDIPAYLECTCLALRFATHCKLRFLAEPTVVWHTDTPGAVTRSREYVLGQTEALQSILRLEMPEDVRVDFQRKLSSSCHECCELLLREGDLRGAWRWHVRSLRHPGGLRHLAFTLKLLRSVRLA
jgi:hypothetical protein